MDVLDRFVEGDQRTRISRAYRHGAAGRKVISEAAIAFREHCAAFFVDFNSNKAA